MSTAVLIRTTRLAAGLTQAELAGRLGTSQGAIAQLERAGANPTVGRLEATLRAMGRRLELTSAPLGPSVDETLLARNLRLSPAERLTAFETAHREVESLRGLLTDGR